MSSTLLRRGTIAAALTLAAGALALPAAAGAKTSVVASGIDNPRGLALAPDGTLYVAASGKGGRLRCIKGEEGDACFGTSGRVLAVKDGRKVVVAKGLLSAAGRDGTFATGPDAVGVAPDGSVLTVMTSGTPSDIASAPKVLRSQAGALLRVAPGARTLVAGVSAFEWQHNADGVKGDRNSNPYGLLALAGHTLVADAGANTILDVKDDGSVSLFALIPRNGKAQPVPTSLALGPDGNVYVGELAFGAGPRKARVWRIPLAGGTPAVAATGFTAITGLAFGPEGTMYVTQLSSNIEKGAPGSVVAVAPDGTRRTISDKGLMFPAGAAADATGVFVSAFSTLPARTPKKGPFRGAGGQVVHITR